MLARKPSFQDVPKMDSNMKITNFRHVLIKYDSCMKISTQFSRCATMIPQYVVICGLGLIDMI